MSRNDTNLGTTFLSFETQTCTADFNVFGGIFGFGNIPNGDFSASTGTASLNANTATNPNFRFAGGRGSARRRCAGHR